MRNLLASAALVAVAPFGASALTVDFTDNSAFSSSTGFTSIVAPGRTVSVSATGDAVTEGDGFSTNPDEKAQIQSFPTATGLALDQDGLGVGDDEVTGAGETMTIDFGGLVEITGIHFLDFFARDDSETVDFEIAFINEGLADQKTFSATMSSLNNPGGYFFSSLAPSLVATSIILSAPVASGTFGDGSNNADDRTMDFALAAIDVNVVPLPASALLLLGGLGGLAALRRRRQTA